MSEVKSLKEIALLAVYNDIEVSLMAKRKAKEEGPPVKKRRKLLTAAKSGNWFVTRNAAEMNPRTNPIDQTKKKLDEYLVSAFSHYREELWRWYNRQSPSKRPPVDAFLECVLDNNFAAMELGVNHFKQGKLLFDA
jgi:hypothetical protein